VRVTEGRKLRARVGDLVRTAKEYNEDTVSVGIVVKREGGKVWVRWMDDNLVMWMPPQGLEVLSENR